MKVLFTSLMLFMAASFAGAQTWSFLPVESLFAPLAGDLREPQLGIVAQTSQNMDEGAIGKTIEILQWHPGDGTHWGWGIAGASFIELVSQGQDRYPERVTDWYLGTYFSESSGQWSHRLEYMHVSSHLGDWLFLYVPRIIYTRESFRYTASFQPSESVRLYAGGGYYPHIAPDDNRFFGHVGAEFYTSAFSFLVGTTGRGYFSYDLKAKGEAGGVADQTFELGFQWKWKKESSEAFRLAVLYYNGKSEYGQFYLQNDNHWGLGFFFDP